MNDASAQSSRRRLALSAAGAPSPETSPRSLITAVSRHPLTATVARRLHERCGVHPEPAPCASPAGSGSAIVVGCSGGPDSIALLLVLTALAKRRSECWPQPIAVTIDHGFRPEAGQECAAVEALAARLAIPCERIAIRPGERPGNRAANARVDRLAALAEVARRRGAAWIALGHHADDRLETLLLGLARGRGLRGMRHPTWRRAAGGGASRVMIVRPLLDTEKRVCEELCCTVGIAVARDPGNGDGRRARGALRVGVLPALTARWPSLAMDASHAVDEADMAVAFIERAARRLLRAAAVAQATTPSRRAAERQSGAPEALRWQRDPLRQADPILRRWALRSAIGTLLRGHAKRVASDHARRREGPTIESIPRSMWERIASAIGDRDRAPRRFELRGIGTVSVRATVVQFSVGTRGGPTASPRAS